MPHRPALSRQRIVDAAVTVADRSGLGQVSMRNVGKELGVEAMSLYHHIDGKDDLLDALADWSFTQIPPPGIDQPWRQAMADRAASARATLSRHPWALHIVESRRKPGPAVLRHHDAVLGCLLHNGFPMTAAAHAFSALDAYVYGFVLSEQNLPFDTDFGVDDMVGDLQETIPADEYPHLTRMFTEQVVGRQYSYADEFDYGLQIILDGIEDRLARAR